MKLQGRTVLMIILLTILVSSYATKLVVSNTAEADLIPQEEELEEDQPNTDALLDQDGKFQKLMEAYEIISKHYALDVDIDLLVEGAIEGMISSLDDPYSAYMDPEEAEEFKASIISSFQGIGAEVTMRDGEVTIVSPIRNTPAERAGLRPNDVIISVNGESIEGLELHQAVMKIRGPEGTEAELEIQRPGLEETFKLTIIRAEIPIETVFLEMIDSNDKKIGKIAMTSFTPSTASDFKEALTKLEEEGIDGLIIDVRGNPGGMLDTVREIGNLLVPNQSVIAKIVSREGQESVLRSTLEEAKPYPISILINNGSASASEILAAALQEAGNYTVIGMPSFGKGTVQSTIGLTDNSELKLTIARWLTPNDNWIHGEGVQPDIEIDQPEYYQALPIQLEPELRSGVTHANVENLQLILSGLGYEVQIEEGSFGPQTEAAIKDFQATHGLEVTGYVNEETVNKLHEELFEVLQNPENDVQLKKAIEIIVGQ